MNPIVKTARIGLVACALICTLGLFAFLPKAGNEDFLKQLGISQTDADNRIIGGFLSGYFDNSGASKLKNLSLGDRKLVMNDVLTYTRKYVSSKAFSDAYQAMRLQQKPKEQKIQSPDEMQAMMISQLRKSVETGEENLKKADASLKPIFEETLASMKQMLKEAEDPNNDQLAVYRETYPDMVEMQAQVYQNQLEEWNTKFPANQNEYIKVRLQEFIDLANNIDYSATLVTKDGKKVFEKAIYEGKDNQWKMGYRTGKELMDVAKGFANDWLTELK